MECQGNNEYEVLVCSGRLLDRGQPSLLEVHADETVLHTLVHCPKISDLRVYVEHLWLHERRNWLSAESKVKITSPPLAGNETQHLPCLATLVKEVVRRKDTSWMER